MEKRRLKKIKILQWLLLIIRTLIIAFLVITFARPTIKSTFSMPFTGAGKTAIIILDDGLNMLTYDRDGMHFQRAKRKLNEILEMYSRKDEVHILKAVSGEKIERSQIADLLCRYKISNWLIVLNRCREIMDGTPNINKELFIISNFHFNIGIQDTLASRFQQLPIYYCSIGSREIYNFSIDTVRIMSQILEIGKPVLFEIMLSNQTPEIDGEIGVHLYIDDKRAAHQQVNIKSGTSKSVEMSYSPKTEKIYQGYIEIDDDDLIADNRYYFSFQILPQIQLLFLDNSPSPFLKIALESIMDKSNVRVTFEQYPNWRRQTFDTYQVLFLSNPGSMEIGLQKKLEAFTTRGSLIIMPGDNTIPDQFNDCFKLIFTGLQLGERVETSSGNGFFTFKPLQSKHPLFNGLYREQNFSPALPHFYKYFQVNSYRPVERLIVFTNDAPFLIRDNHNYLFSAYIDETWTDIQYKGLFTPLLARLFQIAAIKASPTHAQTSPEIPVTVTLQENLSQNKYALRFPDGNVQNLFPVTGNDQILLPIGTLMEPGNYPIYNNQKLATVINVNINRTYLVPPYVELKSNTMYRILTEDINLRLPFISSHLGNELALYALIIVILLLAAEHLVVKIIEGDGTA
jgi:hypothetical protein